MDRTIEGLAPRLVETEDGSLTLYSPTSREHYHSIHGAEQESRHIFLSLALTHRLRGSSPSALNVLEVGFGTGLNALLTWERSRAEGIRIYYTTLELYPIEAEIYRKLSYPRATPCLPSDALERLHEAPWGELVEMDELFILEKRQIDLRDFTSPERYDVVYFDAFSPEAQPQLWEQEIFAHIYQACREGAVLTTYCAKGVVRRAMQSVGFVVERLPGPPGKREILRATKP